MRNIYIKNLVRLVQKLFSVRTDRQTHTYTYQTTALPGRLKRLV